MNDKRTRDYGWVAAIMACAMVAAVDVWAAVWWMAHR